MDFLPKVQMDFIPSDNESDTEGVDDNVDLKIEDFDEEKDVKQDTKQDIVKKIVPQAKSKRENMNVDEIFNLPDNAEVKLTKKGKPRKQRPPMSEEHKEKLKIAREKAMASRIAKAKERKENIELEKQERELLKQQKVKRVQKLKEEVNDEPIKEIKREPIFTKKDLEEAQLQAIMNYEKIRKSRKIEKQEQKKKEAEEESLRNQLRRAIAPPKPEYNNPFSGCY
jgi:hypothetical protein